MNEKKKNMNLKKKRIYNNEINVFSCSTLDDLKIQYLKLYLISITFILQSCLFDYRWISQKKKT